MSLEQTIHTFGEAFRRIELESGRNLFNHHDFVIIENSGIQQQIRRVKGIVQHLKKDKPEQLKELTNSGVHYGFLSSAALTWKYHSDWTFDKVDNLPYYIRHLNLFHNETIMNHFSAYLFGTQGTSALYSLFQDPGWEHINTDYFKSIQDRARRVLDTANKIQVEIISSDNIFKIQNKENILWVGDSTWDLSVDETILLYRNIQLQKPSHFRRYMNVCEEQCARTYFCEGIVPLDAYQSKYQQREIRPHEFIDDQSIQQAFISQKIGSDWSDLREAQETAYLMKESQRIQEMKVLGKEVIDIFQEVDRIIKGIAEQYGSGRQNHPAFPSS